MSFWIDDLDTFLIDFGIDITRGEAIYKGIFHNEYETVGLFDGEIESRKPYIEVKESDFSGIDNSETVEIDDVEYNVIEVEPDGTGMLILRLSKD